MKFLIAGDFVITENFKDKDLLSREIIDLFNKSDFRIINLEAPVTDCKSKIIKTGPHLKSNRDLTRQTLLNLNTNLVTLANNHVLDYDEKGVLDTLNFCRKNNIETVGAGKNKMEASKVFYLNDKNCKVAIINIAENEWASATSEKAGANGMNLIDNIKQIQKAKKENDLVFVIVHGGHEYYNLPSPRTQKQYKFYIDNGADLVVGHHTHCISGMEIYNSKPIYYSLGNFMFTKQSKHNDWYQGLILEVEIKNNNIQTKVHLIGQSKDNFKLSLLKGDEKKAINDRFLTYNAIIKDEQELNNEWNKYIDVKFNTYLNYLSPLNFISNNLFKAFANKLGIKMINRQCMALLLNLLRCEAHLDISKKTIKKYLSK
jgi:poly-gamma-glutamate synthesis protein (capsule biosynthesis protein)